MVLGVAMPFPGSAACGCNNRHLSAWKAAENRDAPMGAWGEGLGCGTHCSLKAEPAPPGCLDLLLRLFFVFMYLA